MVSPILIVIFVLLCLLYAYKYVKYRPEGFPPGPPRIPMFGSYLFLLLVDSKYLHKAAMFFSKWYKARTVGLFVGPFPTVVANNFDVAKEVLNRKEFDGRPDIFAARLRDPDYNRKGIFFVEGPQWKGQRRFVLRFLRDFGFGRRFQDLEVVMNEEIQDMIDMIKNGPKHPHENHVVNGDEILLPQAFSPPSTNSFLHILCNERLPRSEQESLVEIFKAGIKFQRTGDDYGRLLSLMPWIRFFFPNMSGFKPLRESNAVLYRFFQKIVDKNLNTYEDGHDRNFLDLYFAEMKKAKETGEKTEFLYDQLILSLVDFAFPAITAVPTQIALLVQWFLLRPDVLQKVQAEIDDVVGHGRLPCLDDRQDLPYTEATIRECLRIETLVPSSIPHKATVDTELDGFKIPAETIVIPSLYAMHSSKEAWGDPENFRPERFLDDNGKLSLKKDISVPFGAGKRLCAGETFARNMLFLIVGAFCQNFSVVLKPGQKPPDLSKNLVGIILSPPDFWVKVVPR